MRKNRSVHCFAERSRRGLINRVHVQKIFKRKCTHSGADSTYEPRAQYFIPTTLGFAV